MKKIIYISVAVLMVLVSLTSCKGFLNVTPRNKKVVRTVEDERDILASYIFFMKNYNRSQMNILGIGPYAYPKFDVSQSLSLYTGESELVTWPQFYNKQNNQYTTQGYNYLAWLNDNSEIWERYYSFLGGINMLIASIDNMQDDDPHLKDYVKGEALAWRAYCYYKLLQYYSPYNNAQLGIPIYLDPSDDVGNAMPARKTQKEVFDFILKDCNSVLSLLKTTPTNDWNMIYREDFIHAMMASIYLWKSGSASKQNNDLKDALDNAKDAIGNRKLVTSTDELKHLFDCKKEVLEVPFDSPEFYVRITDNSKLLFTSEAYRADYTGSSIANGKANMDYYKKYADNDRRKSFYFYNSSDSVVMNNKYNIENARPDLVFNGCFMPFRLAEMYLIKAEAECRMGDVASAINTLNTFRASRYDNPNPFNGDKNTILNEILMERQREFLLENDMLWLDMKRLGKTLSREVNGKTETLKPDDFRYTFPIPKRELQNNKNIKQAPEWSKYNF